MQAKARRKERRQAPSRLPVQLPIMLKAILVRGVPLLMLPMGSVAGSEGAMGTAFRSRGRKLRHPPRAAASWMRRGCQAARGWRATMHHPYYKAACRIPATPARSCSPPTWQGCCCCHPASDSKASELRLPSASCRPAWRGCSLACWQGGCCCRRWPSPLGRVPCGLSRCRGCWC